MSKQTEDQKPTPDDDFNPDDIPVEGLEAQVHETSAAQAEEDSDD